MLWFDFKKWRLIVCLIGWKGNWSRNDVNLSLISLSPFSTSIHPSICLPHSVFIHVPAYSSSLHPFICVCLPPPMSVFNFLPVYLVYFFSVCLCVCIIIHFLSLYVSHLFMSVYCLVLFILVCLPFYLTSCLSSYSTLICSVCSFPLSGAGGMTLNCNTIKLAPLPK